MKQLLVATTLLILMAACNKKVPPNSTKGDPVFLFKGKINNLPASFVAGDSSIYMSTDFYKDDQNIITLKGNFGIQNCMQCEPSLTIELKDVRPSANNYLYNDIYTLFEKNIFYSYSIDSFSQAILSEYFIFTPDSLPTGATCFWDFGDGTTSNDKYAIHRFDSSGIRNVTLITTLNNLHDTITFPIDITIQSDCRTRFTTTIDYANKHLVANAEGLFKSYYWDFGDGQEDVGVSTNHTYSQNKIYEIKLSVSNSNCMAQFKKRINLSGNTQFPLANFYYMPYLTRGLLNSKRINTSAAIITLKQNNKTYKSYKTNDLTNQSTKKIIEIENYEPYKNNINGDKTFKLKANIDLYLYNINNNNDSIPIKSEQLILGIAYPS